MTANAKMPRLAIVGRPNVGKSTLFNRLLGRRRALVHDEPGVTRDRLEEKAKWWVQGRRFPVLLVDTGGLGGDRFADEIAQQVQIALSQADIVIVLFDGQTGFTSQDREVLKQLKRSGLFDRKDKTIVGVVNKVDTDTHEDRITDFFATGIDPILTISAEHARGITDLQEKIGELYGIPDAEILPEEPYDDEIKLDKEVSKAERKAARDSTFETVDEDDDTIDDERVSPSAPGAAPGGIPRVAILGRPNVGKSTLVNALTGEERMIASPIAGTTVDSVDSPAVIGGKKFLLIDTAGIRRKSKTEQGVEVLSVIQSRKAIERCDVAVLLLDGETGLTDQDEKIGGLIEDVGCGVILVVNKWDTQRKKQDFTREVAAGVIRKKMAYLRYAPILFVSAKENQGLDDLGELVLEILEQRRVKVATREITEWIRAQSGIHNPKDAKFYMCHQSGRHPPTFVCHVSDPDKIHFSLRRNLLNGIREKWGYMGNPVRLLFVKGTSTRTKDPTKGRKGDPGKVRMKVKKQRKREIKKRQQG